MKKLMLFAAMVCAIASAPAFAHTPAIDDGEVIINVNQLEGKQFILHLANLEQQTTNIKLEDLQGTVYYTEMVRKHNGYAKKLNLRKLPEGRYILSVLQDNKKFVQVVVIQDDKLMFSKISEK